MDVFVPKKWHNDVQVLTEIYFHHYDQNEKLSEICAYTEAYEWENKLPRATR